MKVLQIYKDYYPPIRGGIEGHINLLANGLVQKGIDVRVLVSNTSSKLEKACIDRIEITKVPQIGRFASASLNMNFSYWINKLGKEADLLHFHFPNPTAEVSYLVSGLNKPVIVTYHSDIIRQARLLKIYSPFLKQFLKHADEIIITSPNYLKTSPYLQDFRSKCTLVPFGIDLLEFNIDGHGRRRVKSIRNEHGNSIILFIGKFRYYKGLHVLIESMNKIEGKLLLIGGGPLEANLKKQIKRLGLENRVAFLGELPDPEKIEYLHACDVFVLPSIYRSEAFGIVQLEAMACSKPIVCTELGTGTSFVNQHNITGLVVKPNDPDSLSKSIQSLLNDPQKKAEFGESGYDRVSRYFSRERMVDEVISVYQRRIRSVPVSTDGVRVPLPSFEHTDIQVPFRKIKVLRIISRLNIGGPAIHAYLLTKNLNREYFDSILVTGRLSNSEGDMSFLFDSLDNKPVYISALQRELSPLRDLIAFVEILRIIFREKPDIVHTHTTKAGASTRFAVFLYGIVTWKKLKTIHTFHGHVFAGYFNEFISKIIVWIERFLMRITDLIIAISPTQYRELTQKYRIAPSHKVVTRELGFNLELFIDTKQRKRKFRKGLGIEKDAVLIGIIGRLVPIKNHKMFLNAAAHFIKNHAHYRVKFVVIGDGELRDQLNELADRLGLNNHVTFCGWLKDVSEVYADLDILALTSLNEGTPVSIIEAMASSVPVIATNAGGVVDLLGPTLDHSNGFKICERGILCQKNDSIGFSQGLSYLINMNPKDEDDLLNRACEFVKSRYRQERLIQDIEQLYTNLIAPTSQ